MTILSLGCPCNVLAMLQPCCCVLPLFAISWRCRDIAMMLLMLSVDVATLNLDVTTLQNVMSLVF